MFFTCSSCGGSFKKSQVEAHLSFKCRSAQYVSCLDCSKDFWGNSYSEHTTCITENQKYGGSSYVHKIPKGQQKQEDWVTLIKKYSNAMIKKDSRLAPVFDKITSCSNLPKKEKQFKNFMKSTMGRLESHKVDEIWEMLLEVKKEQAEVAKALAKQSSKNETSKEETDATVEIAAEVARKKSKMEKKQEKRLKKKQESNKMEDTEENKDKIEACAENSVEEKKKNKREKKRERSGKKHKMEEGISEDLKGKTKKSKKRKASLEENGEGINEQESLVLPKRKKCKKSNRSNKENEENYSREVENSPIKETSRLTNGNLNDQSMTATNGRLNDTLVEDTPLPFKWKTSIQQVMENAPQEGMKLKKLERKVVAKYFELGGENGHVQGKDKVKALFKKKLFKSNKFIVDSDVVRIRSGELY